MRQHPPKNVKKIITIWQKKFMKIREFVTDYSLSQKWVSHFDNSFPKKNHYVSPNVRSE